MQNQLMDLNTMNCSMFVFTAEMRIKDLQTGENRSIIIGSFIIILSSHSYIVRL